MKTISIGQYHFSFISTTWIRMSNFLPVMSVVMAQSVHILTSITGEVGIFFSPPLSNELSEPPT
jgi:hypothetical protein